MASDFKTVYNNGAGSQSPPVQRRPHSHTRRGREFATRLVESPSYRAWLTERIEKKSLDPSLERMLWAYAYGKPKEYVEITDRRLELTDASSEQLHARAKQLASLLARIDSATTKEEAESLLSSLDEASAPLH